MKKKGFQYPLLLLWISSKTPKNHFQKEEIDTGYISDNGKLELSLFVTFYWYSLFWELPSDQLTAPICIHSGSEPQKTVHSVFKVRNITALQLSGGHGTFCIIYKDIHTHTVIMAVLVWWFKALSLQVGKLSPRDLRMGQQWHGCVVAAQAPTHVS